MNNLPVFYDKAKTPAQGFATKFLAPNSPEQRHLFSLYIANWNKRKTLNAMAVVNGIIYSIAKRYGAVTYVMVDDGESEKRDYTIHRNKLQRLVKNGCDYLKTSIMGLRTYVKDHWKMASSNGNAVRAVRDALHEMGLIKAIKTHKGGYSWSVFRNIDVAGLFVLYEMLEESLLNYWFVPFEELPEHKGLLVKKLYNTASNLLGKLYRRLLSEGAVGRDMYGNEVYRPGELPPEPIETESEDTEPTTGETPCQSPTSQDPTPSATNLRRDTRECAVPTSTVVMSRWQDL